MIESIRVLRGHTMISCKEEIFQIVSGALLDTIVLGLALKFHLVSVMVVGIAFLVLPHLPQTTQPMVVNVGQDSFVLKDQ